MEGLTNEEKSSRVIRAVISGTMIKFTVRDAGEVEFDATKVNGANRAYAEMHGWKQRMVDDCAGLKSNGEKLEAIRNLVTHYESGADAWSLKRVTRELTQEQKLELYNKLKAELGI